MSDRADKPEHWNYENKKTKLRAIITPISAPGYGQSIKILSEYNSNATRNGSEVINKSLSTIK